MQSRCRGSPRALEHHLLNCTRQLNTKMMSTPSLIYRYQNPKRRNLDNVKNNVLWLSRPATFNDPFDCAKAMIHDRPNEFRADLFYDAFLNLDDSQMMDFAKSWVEQERIANGRESASPSDIYFRQQLTGASGVACFSELSKHLLMWSHYADSHKGYCLEFSTEYAPFCDQLYKVTYQNAMPTIVVSEREIGDVVDLRAFLLIKARVWSYEKEWRVVSELSDTTIEYPPEALKRILVGAKATTRTVNGLKRAVDTRRIEIVRLKLANDRFRLEESST